MKRFVMIVVAMFCIASVQSVSAQNLFNGQNILEGLKGAATSIIDQVTDGKATEVMMTGSWSYNAPAMRLTGSDALSSALASTAVTSIETRLKKVYEYVGIKPGSCTFTFNTDGSFAMVLGKRSYAGTYVYTASTHAVELTFNSKLLKLGSMKGYAYLDSESTLDLVFDCSKFFNLLVKLGAKVSSTGALTQLLSKYDGMMIGFGLSR